MGNQVLISHRGNLNGPDPRHENMPEYITEALRQGFDCEVDVWKVGEELFLGHDNPQYKIPDEWLVRIGLWWHCKNIEAASYAVKARLNNAFWHQQDDCVIITGGYLWTYPGKPLTDKSIAVLPESVENWDTGVAYGVCTDYPLKYRAKTYLK